MFRTVCRGTAANHVIYHSNLNLLTIPCPLISVIAFYDHKNVQWYL